MNFENWDLDELVGKIMADLRQNAGSSAANVGQMLTRDFQRVGGAATVSQGSGSEKTVDSQNDASEKGGVYEVAERVITVETVAKIASETREKVWRVKRGAVVTPAAKDELKKRGVELTTQPSAASTQRVAQKAAQGQGSKSVPSVLLVVHNPAMAAARPVREYLTRCADFAEEQFDCVIKSAQRIADELQTNPDRLAVLATQHSGMASVRLNRFKGVRAVVAHSVEQAKRDLPDAKANALIVDSNSLGSYQIRQVVDFFLRMERK